MASTVPASLKSADIARFAHRASQVQTARPVIAYWCDYWIVNQILAHQLHTADDEALSYTTTLMDSLEKVKLDRADDPSIMDDNTGKAAVLEFSQETFDRAQRAVDANKVTRRTADTFHAAATFFELLNIWGTPDPETTKKIKYAKWNATRILKALREGLDPNETNPRPVGPMDDEAGQDKEADEDGSLPTLDPSDPEVQMLMGSGGAAPTSRPQPYLPPMPRPVVIEDVIPDPGEPRPSSTAVSPLEPTAPAIVSAPSSPFPSTLPSSIEQVSPLAPPEPPTVGSYFPAVQSASGPPPPPLPLAPPAPPPKLSQAPQLSDIDFYGTSPSQQAPPPFVDAPPPGQVPPPVGYHSTPPPVAPHVAHPPPAAPVTQSYAHRAPPAPPMPQQYSQPHPHSQPPHQSNPQLIPGHAASGPSRGQERYTASDRNMVEAQKHAKWAISALNFEDVPTAVKELRIALDQLLE